jgi:hypothetical protein
MKNISAAPHPPLLAEETSALSYTDVSSLLFVVL